MAGRLEGKRAVAVGAGQRAGATLGIGRAAALLFAKEGAKVLVVDRDEASAEETRLMIVDAGGTAVTHTADITDEQSCESIASRAKQEFGGADVLYHSVGIHGSENALATTVELWDSVIDVNLKAVWLVAKAFLPMMIDQKGGSIVTISSIASVHGSSIPYGVSKAGVNRITLAIATEYAKHLIRANTILPGLVDTPMAIEGGMEQRGLTREQYLAQREASVPMPLKANAMDIAYAALYFASDESRYVTGQCLAVDGAYLLK